MNKEEYLKYRQRRFIKTWENCSSITHCPMCNNFLKISDWMRETSDPPGQPFKSVSCSTCQANGWLTQSGQLTMKSE